MIKDGPITYQISPWYRRYNVEMKDPIFGRPWYLKHVRKGVYTWVRDPLYAAQYTECTALRHCTDLAAGADKKWPWYRNHWKEYWESLGMLGKEETL